MADFGYRALVVEQEFHIGLDEDMRMRPRRLRQRGG
jgi:hypothetical protein